MSRADKAIPLERIEKLAETVNNSKNPITYMSVDPGTYNGICGYDNKYYLQFMYTVKAENLVDFLMQFKEVKLCIYEGFRLFPNKALQQMYSDMETPRMIGRIETWSKLNKIELVKQDPSIKKTGYAWIGKKPPAKGSGYNDPMDAHVHFMYWAIKNGKISAADILKNYK